MNKAKRAQLRSQLIRLGFELFAGTGAHNCVRTWTGGRGFILMLHRVARHPAPAFDPNGFLTVQADYLSAVLDHVQQKGWHFVSLDEAHRRLVQQDYAEPFCAVTFDDGYLDNYEIAKPILEAHKVPYTVYAATGFIDQTISPWWLMLERLVGERSVLSLQDHGGRRLDLRARDIVEKHNAFLNAVSFLRETREQDQEGAVRAAAEQEDLDLSHFNVDLAMSWDQVRCLSNDELGSIGGHTINHYAVAKLSDHDARSEIVGGLDRLETMTGKRPEHFAYPYGDAQAASDRDYRLLADLGLKSAVTTKPGLLFADHDRRLTALPRVSLNGNYQSLSHLEILISGAAFYLYNGFRRVVPADPVRQASGLSEPETVRVQGLSA